mmetsp:Transcript_54899/g.66127  ORF Transcript_54899/g.66127 Transcript_54899/m.66127 type:complete len:81 (+) Transcript_54899:108-350(+)
MKSFLDFSGRPEAISQKSTKLMRQNSKPTPPPQQNNSNPQILLRSEESFDLEDKPYQLKNMDHFLIIDSKQKDESRLKMA